MAKQLLIYERAVPVSSSAHRELSIASSGGLGFARNVNSVPVVAAEFLAASREFAIVFAGEGDAVMPSVILGLREDQNVFVDDEGRWDGSYVPAFLRRYPFVFSRATDDGDFTLCIDEDFAGLNTDGKGERLFDSDGNRTQYLDNIVGFVTQYQAQFDATRALCDKLRALDLLEPAQAQVRLPDGRKSQLAGFLRVSREKLANLSDEALLGLAKSGELELIHAHLHSLSAIRGMAEKAAKRGETVVVEDAVEAEPEGVDA